jgi:putative acetyltransferase
MLRLGSEKDFDALYPIYMHPTVNPYLSFEIMSQEEFLPIFNELIQSGALYIYENTEGQVLATCIVLRLKRRCAHTNCLTTLATNPNFQRQGIGTKFIRDLINEIRKNEEIKRIELYAEADNEIALNFYKKKVGFQEEEHLKKYYKRANENHFVDELILAIIFD